MGNYPKKGLKESTATFLTFMVGEAIALVAQTCNMPGTMQEFLMMWMLLIVPLIYILGVSVPALIHICVAQRYGLAIAILGGGVLCFGRCLPQLYLIFFSISKKNSYKIRFYFLSWAIALSFCWATGMALGRAFPVD